MSTKITTAGIAAATRARNNQGPKINITSFKIGSSLTPPVGNEIDITPDLVYTGFPSQLQYAIVNDNTVQYIVTLDESIGPFDIGRIGLFMDNGDGTSTLFSVTTIDALNADHKFPTAGGTVGNRLSYNIYLAISNIANIANFTIQLLQLLTIPEVPSELSLPNPDQVAFNTYQVMKHSITRIPAIAYRETAAQGKTPSAWFMGSERLIPGQGEGVVPLGTNLFDPLAAVGLVVGLDSQNQKIIVGEPATNRYILGIRSSLEEITNYGIYVDTNPNPAIAYSPMLKLYADTAPNAGKVTATPNSWPIGYALGPVNTSNAVGYACWIDFTMGFGAVGIPGPQGPKGDTGPPGTGGTGGGGGFANSGQCYLSLSSGVLLLSPYNGNNIIINSTVRQIPSGGVALPATGLQPNALYYIYAFMGPNNVMTLEASTANHVTSTFDGTEIKNYDQSRTLVGMAWTQDGPVWADTSTEILVLSWFNPRRKSSTTHFTSNHSSGASTFVEIGAEIRNYFLTWANREVSYVTGGYSGANGGDGVGTIMSFDGFGFEKYSLGCNLMGARPTRNDAPTGVMGARSNLSEGLHYGTLKGMLAGGGPGTAYWNITIPTGSSNIDAPVSLTVTVMG